MEKNEFYLSSLELVKERIENRLNEAENTAIENETESLFVWMLLQFHWKMEEIIQLQKVAELNLMEPSLEIHLD